MEWIIIIVGVFLLIASIIDWIFRVLPSIFLTTMLFVVAFMFPSGLLFGVLGFILAYLLYEIDFFSGVADIKVMTTLSFMLTSTNWLLVYLLLVVTLGTFWKVVSKYILKEEIETAFVPVFLFAFIALLALGGINGY